MLTQVQESSERSLEEMSLDEMLDLALTRAFLILNHVSEHHVGTTDASLPGTTELLSGVEPADAVAVWTALQAVEDDVRDLDELWPASHVLACARLALGKARPLRWMTMRHITQALDVIDDGLAMLNGHDLAKALNEAPAQVAHAEDSFWEPFGGRPEA